MKWLQKQVQQKLWSEEIEQKANISVKSELKQGSQFIHTMCFLEMDHRLSTSSPQIIYMVHTVSVIANWWSHGYWGYGEMNTFNNTILLSAMFRWAFLICFLIYCDGISEKVHINKFSYWKDQTIPVEYNTFWSSDQIRG